MESKSTDESNPVKPSVEVSEEVAEPNEEQTQVASEALQEASEAPQVASEAPQEASEAPQENVVDNGAVEPMDTAPSDVQPQESSPPVEESIEIAVDASGDHQVESTIIQASGDHQEETTTIQVVFEVPEGQQQGEEQALVMATEGRPQDAVENEMILMAEAAAIAAAEAASTSQPEVNTQIKSTVTVNGAPGSQPTEMEVDPTPATQTPVKESPPQTSTTPVPGTPVTPGNFATPPATFDDGTPVTTITTTILQNVEDGVMPIMLERAESEVSYMIPFDQQSLMSSTLGSPGVRKCGICGKVYRYV